MLSIVIIVRDGHKWIDGCLDSLEGAPEVVLVGNGGDNRHKLRANETWVESEMRGHLGVLRNIGISKARGDTILSMDIDERIEGEIDWDIEGAWGIKVEGWGWSKGIRSWWSSRSLRIFPRNARWVGGIHEHPRYSGEIKEYNKARIVNLGYDIELAEWEKKYWEYENRIIKELRYRDDRILRRQLEKSLEMRNEQNAICRAEGSTEGGKMHEMRKMWFKAQFAEAPFKLQG